MIRKTVLRRKKLSVVFATLLFPFLNNLAIAQDPFLSYLIGKPPTIVKEIGIETNDSVTIRKLIFHSRDVQTINGITASDIFAAIVRPNKPGRYPGLLILHGGGGFAEVDRAVKWAAQGYIVLVLDEPGIAFPEKALLSEGHWKNYPYGQHRFTANPDITTSTVFDGVLSAIQGLYLLRDQTDVNKDRIGVVGISWGGYLTTMITGIASRYIHASFSVFGSGFYDYGSSFLRELNAMPESEKELWLQYLDAGRRIEKVKTPFFIAAAADDNFFYPPAVMATLDAMKGPVNHLFAPNANHKIPVPGGSITKSTNRPGWLEMELTWFNYYLKGIGEPFPRIDKATQIEPERDVINHSSSDKNSLHIRFAVKSSYPITEAKVFYSAKITDWTKRNWLSVDAVKADDGSYYAILPPEAGNNIDWFASVSDSRPVTVSSMIISGK
jgi:cephalosporin-C deacetylase-like acetyl esterase